MRTTVEEKIGRLDDMELLAAIDKAIEQNDQDFRGKLAITHSDDNFDFLRACNELISAKQINVDKLDEFCKTYIRRHAPIEMNLPQQEAQTILNYNKQLLESEDPVQTAAIEGLLVNAIKHAKKHIDPLLFNKIKDSNTPECMTYLYNKTHPKEEHAAEKESNSIGNKLMKGLRRMVSHNPDSSSQEETIKRGREVKEQFQSGRKDYEQTQEASHEEIEVLSPEERKEQLQLMDSFLKRK